MLRLTALALGLLAAGTARAEAPRAGITVPAGWRALPKVAAAVAAGAHADGASVEASEAWGDPGRGCFAAWVAVRGGIDATVEPIVASVAGAGATVSEVEPSAGGVALRFARPPFHGTLRAALEGPAIRALACFGDGREPLACDAACATVMNGAPR